MKLFDRARLLVRSAFGSLADRLQATPARRGDRSLDKARAHLEILRQDLAGAERRGDEALADRLRRELDELQRLLDRAQARRQAAGPSSTNPQGAKTHEAAAKPDAPHRASDEALDDTRIADQIRQARDRE